MLCAELARIGSDAAKPGIGAHAERGACSGAAPRQTRAERVEERWIVNDENTDNSNGACADFTVKAVCTSAPGSRHDSSLPIVERCEGVSTSKLEQLVYRLG
jgi:alkylation response protein AidB-like acyl-CoA dehydrogenase